MTLKFCYGLPITLNPTNVAALRCASEFLEMTEAYEDGNLIAKTEAFFTFVVLSSWTDTITVLKSCETLSPWADSLQIVRRCCDSISCKVSRETASASAGDEINGQDWWFDDMASLRVDHFTRIVATVQAKGVKPELIGSCIMHCARKWLPRMEMDQFKGGLLHRVQWSVSSGRSTTQEDGDSVRHCKEQKLLVENLVSILPSQKEAVPCKFLLWMLKIAHVYAASPALISELEKRIGMVLEDADVNDLLVPNHANANPNPNPNPNKSPEDCFTMHNISAVQRIIEYYFLMNDEDDHDQQQQQPPPKPGRLSIGKLLDSYLAEIAREPNLSVAKFQALAEGLPANARTCHDGLYRAIDTYLKTHPLLSEHDRRRVSKIMDCDKLSPDACSHAAQNDRLPLRTIIQVLFSEQVKLREASRTKRKEEASDQEEGSSWSNTKEIKILKIELEKVKIDMQELQKDYMELQKECDHKLNYRHKSVSGWANGWKKIKKSGIFNRKDVDHHNEHRREGGERPSYNGGSSRISLRRRLSSTY
ncbi:BTB/POZ domain-containing protein DOT3 [Impatiens glandulifera]|uniref:BTB/POZ domain-containing protein DOT3 n=1 Tax=Impatiens glandulifera TaxID=253017 RepID=UPI001FB0823E|nr:BTB/POZ domain-containing protein DOT3 [Impatiens glandulifera]